MGNMENSRFVTKKGEPLALSGKNVSLGEKAENFIALKQDSSVFDFFNETKGKVKIISVVPSVDTSVCALQTQRFNQEAVNLSDEVIIITISVDFTLCFKKVLCC